MSFRTDSHLRLRGAMVARQIPDLKAARSSRVGVSSAFAFWGSRFTVRLCRIPYNVPPKTGHIRPSHVE